MATDQPNLDEYDASALPTSNPGGNKPWRFAGATGWQVVVGAFTPAASGGVTDHGALTGLADDDHTQYFNQARGDVRYSRASYALQCQMVPGAFGAGPYSAFVLGAVTGTTADNGGLFAIGRRNRATMPYVGFCGWDNGVGRYLYFGGGGWGVPDATAIGFYTATAYDEINGGGRTRIAITDVGQVTVQPSADFIKFGDYALGVRSLNTAFPILVTRAIASQTANHIQCESSAGAVELSVAQGGHLSITGLFSPGTYTVATLPSASANPGRIAEVTDSSVTTYRSNVAGGGSNRVNVKSNGTNWLVN